MKNIILILEKFPQTLFLLLLLIFATTLTLNKQSIELQPAAKNIRQSFVVPAVFIEKQNQLQENSEFMINLGAMQAGFNLQGIHLSAKDEPSGLFLSFQGISANARIYGENPQPGVYNYFIGDTPDSWQKHLRGYESCYYQNIYNGIDMRIRLHNNQLEYDLLLTADSRPEDVVIRCEGAAALSLNKEGRLIMTVGDNGKIIQQPPLAWYILPDSSKSPADCRFRIISAYSYGFQVAQPRGEYPLVIDPLIDWSTYLGGNNLDIVKQTALDAAGNIYVCGESRSPNFPATSTAFQNTMSGSFSNAFVAKFNSSGQLVYASYLGGSSSLGDHSTAIAVDAAGHAYIVGETKSDDFPTTPGAFQSGRSFDAFISKFTPDGGSLSYSTNLGGGQPDIAYGIALDDSGNAYITGETRSNDFPISSGAVQSVYIGGFSDIFVTKLNATGSAIKYSTYIAGRKSEQGFAIAVDDAGNAYVTGETASDNFPISTNAYQPTFTGDDEDIFLAKLNPGATTFLYSTYLGGSPGFGNVEERGYGIQVDSEGRAYIIGETLASDFPTTANAAQNSHGGGKDVFLSVFSSLGNALIYSTYLGGDGEDTGNGIALGPAGRVYISGVSASVNFPIVNQIPNGSGSDVRNAFISIVDINSGNLLFSSHLGGDNDDVAHALSVTPGGAIYVAGETASLNFPTINAAQTNSGGGLRDGFIARIDPELTGISASGNSSVDSHRLYPNFPNPFNPATNIRYYLPRATRVTLKIYDTLGQEINTLVSQYQTSGEHLMAWDGNDHLGFEASSGLYFYQLTAGDFIAHGKMILLR